jgi:hypothetical protein
MKPILARWMLLWLRSKKLSKLDDNDIIVYMIQGNSSNPSISAKVRNTLGDDHVKMLNLSHDWLESFLPFVIQKINRVHFGLLHRADINMLESDGVKVPTSRKLTAVPFVAKDVPSRASEFAHPDILIGLTVLAYRYEGLRETDFVVMMQFLKDNMENEGGAHYRDRPSCQRFEVTCIQTFKSLIHAYSFRFWSNIAMGTEFRQNRKREQEKRKGKSSCSRPDKSTISKYDDGKINGSANIY